MAKPIQHAERSAKRFGGSPEDYLDIHQEFDTPKAAFAGHMHRVVFHHAFGIFLIERLYGKFIVNCDGKRVATRDIAEQHVLDDLGFIPTLEDWCERIEHAEWMGGSRRFQFRIVDWRM